MAWSWHDIQQQWLAAPEGSTVAIAYSPETVVRAFELVENKLGHAWIDAIAFLLGGGHRAGSAPTLEVVTTGLVLSSLEGVKGAAALVGALKERKADAWSEACAIYLVRQTPGVEVEYAPAISVGKRNRVPDFRMRLEGLPWTYVEVAKPDDSKTKRRLQEVMWQLSMVLQSLPCACALEVYLLREPSPEELGVLSRSVLKLANEAFPVTEQLNEGLGLVISGGTPGSMGVDYHGLGCRPGIGMSTVIWGPDEPHRHLMVRIAFSDDRAQNFLRAEARQLPKDSPAIVMLDVGRATGAMHFWADAIAAELQPQKHTRVGTVCLFESVTQPSQAGEQWVHRTKVILNPHASHPISARLREALALPERLRAPE